MGKRRRIGGGMAKKKRKMSAAQKAALAKGRAKMAAKRGGRKAKKSAPKAARKTAKRKTVKKGLPIMAKRRKKARSGGGGFRGKARRAVSRARGFFGKSSGPMAVVKDAALAVGGGIAAGVLANKLPVADPRLKAAAPIAAGVALAATLGRKNEMAKGFATGMVVLGAVALLKQLAPNVPMLAGEEEMMYVPQLPYSPEMLGEGVQLGYDDDELATMGEQIELGEEYVSPASL